MNHLINYEKNKIIYKKVLKRMEARNKIVNSNNVKLLLGGDENVLTKFTVEFNRSLKELMSLNDEIEKKEEIMFGMKSNNMKQYTEKVVELFRDYFQKKEINKVFHLIKILGPTILKSCEKYVMGNSRPGQTNFKNLRTLQDQKIMFELFRREYFTSTIAWAIPSRKCLKKIKKFAGKDVILEINSGSGFWAALIRIFAKVKVIATEPFYNYQFSHKYSFVPLKEMDGEEAVIRYSKCGVLLTVWPNLDDDYSARCLSRYKGDKLIYVGEDEGGCTGCYDFFNILKDQWILTKKISIPNWCIVHDKCFFYKRKQPI